MAVIIYGAGGQARVLLELMDRAGICPIAGILDDNPALEGTKLEGIPILGSPDKLAGQIRVHHIHRAVIAIGDNQLRQTWAQHARSLGLRLPVLIHPSAIVSPTAHLGEGTVVLAGAVVAAHARIGELCIINTRASVDHDCVLGDAVHVAPGATLCGGITVGNGVFIGAGATLIPELIIGDNALIGAGATVLHDVCSNTTVVGCPAREIPRKTNPNLPLEATV